MDAHEGGVKPILKYSDTARKSGRPDCISTPTSLRGHNPARFVPFRFGKFTLLAFSYRFSGRIVFLLRHPSEVA